MKKRGQIGIEYMILIGFLTFAIMAVLALAIFYSGQIKDKIKLNQIEKFATQLVNFAESVFFSGEPSKTTVRLYLPEGVTDININQNYIIFTSRVSEGENIRGFKSRVPINGTISTGEGIKTLTLTATNDYLLIEE